jgi:hypothetical protein
MKNIYSTIHISCSYNNMKTYTIYKKKTEKKHKRTEKNFKCVFEGQDEVFWPRKWR